MEQKNSYRWLAAMFVGVAILGILVWKTVVSPNDTGGLAVAEGLAVASAPTWALPTVSAAAATVAPLPKDPAAQIEWARRNQRPAMILFHSTNCIPCKAMTKLVEQVRGEYEPRVLFIDVITNDTANVKLLQQAQIRAIPTSFFLSRGGQSRSYVGAMAESELRKELANLTAGS